MYTILSLTDSDKHFSSALAEYSKRLPRDLTLIDLKPTRADHPEQAKARDTDKLLKRLDKHRDKYDQFILLSIAGKDMTTEKWVRSFPLGRRYCFII